MFEWTGVVFLIRVALRVGLSVAGVFVLAAVACLRRGES